MIGFVALYLALAAFVWVVVLTYAFMRYQDATAKRIEDFSRGSYAAADVRVAKAKQEILSRLKEDALKTRKVVLYSHGRHIESRWVDDDFDDDTIVLGGYVYHKLGPDPGNNKTTIYIWNPGPKRIDEA
jgi:hypothetical protein